MAVWWQVTTWEDAEMPFEVTGAAGPGKEGPETARKANRRLTTVLLSSHTMNSKGDNPIDESADGEWFGWAMFRAGVSLEQAHPAAGISGLRLS